MKRNVTLEEISDGKLYTSNDLVKADCGGCKDCSACCQNMGESIVLDPYDIWQLKRNLQMSFEELLVERIELHVVDGLILPNLKMSDGEENQCSFLDQNGRCSIHIFRPGICRLFPLGRYYEEDTFRYILQIHECRNMNRSKVKVKKWLGIPDLKAYEQFVLEWHAFLENVRSKLEGSTDEQLRKQLTMWILQEFYLKELNDNFYLEVQEKIDNGKTIMGL